MRHLSIALVAVAMSASWMSAGAQATVEPQTVDIQLARQQEKELKKLVKVRTDAFKFQKAAQAMKQGYFVMLIDRLCGSFSPGMATGLNEQANFVLLQGDKGVFQTAALQGACGPNGLGGITVKGNVRNVRLKTTKKGDLYMTYHMQGVYGNADVSVTVYKDSDEAMAVISPTFGPGSITAYGHIAPYRNKSLNIK